MARRLTPSGAAATTARALVGACPRSGPASGAPTQAEVGGSAIRCKRQSIRCSMCPAAHQHALAESLLCSCTSGQALRCSRTIDALSPEDSRLAACRPRRNGRRPRCGARHVRWRRRSRHGVSGGCWPDGGAWQHGPGFRPPSGSSGRPGRGLCWSAACHDAPECRSAAVHSLATAPQLYGSTAAHHAVRA